MAVYDDFAKLDVRAGTILEAEDFPKAKRPAYKLTIDFGQDIGIKKSSAQITSLYSPEELNGKKLLAVVNFPPRQIADFMSEVLVLGPTALMVSYSSPQTNQKESSMATSSGNTLP